VTEPAHDEPGLPEGYRISPRVGGTSAELRRRQPSWGWVVVVVVSAWCVIWDLALLSSIGIGPKANWSGWPEDPVARWLIFFPVFWIPGIAITALTLYQIFGREAWLLRSGHVTRRQSIFGLLLQREYDVTNVEIIHATWSSGGGASEKVCLVVSSQQRLELIHQSDESIPITPEILALATVVAGHLAVPMRVVETVIPQPSSD